MTLLLTFVHRNSVIHAADRLVSRGDQPFDRESNKTVVFQARDGVGVVSYTGAAHIGGKHTDEIIASAIFGEDAVPVGVPEFTVRFDPPGRVPDVGKLSLDVARALREAADEAGVRERDLPRFVMAGIKWKRRSATFLVSIEPFLWVGRRRPGRGTYSMSGKPWDRRPWLQGLPHEWIGTDEAQALFDRCVAHGVNLRAVANELAGMIREVAARHPNAVGSDVMTVIIPNPAADRKLTIRFEGVASAYGGWLPWIVQPGFLIAPAQSSDGWNISFPPWDIVTEAPRGPEDGMGPSLRRRPRT